MQLDLSADQVLIRDAVRDLCAREFGPQASSWDREAVVPRQAVARLAEQGFLGMAIPEDWGGVGYDSRTLLIVLEEIARVSAALAIMIAVHNSVGALPVFRLAPTSSAGASCRGWSRASSPRSRSPSPAPARTRARSRQPPRGRNSTTY